MRHDMQDTIFTVGHSTHSRERFIELLQRHDISAICDVRSKPYSRVNPQFNREELKLALRAVKISYVSLGKELGARSDDPDCYVNGKVQYARLAKTSEFQSGIERIMEGMKKHRIALMCAEKEPLDCHRTILVARHLAETGVKIQHIHANAGLESQTEALHRLMKQLGIREEDMFRSQSEIFAEAYAKQEERIAYSTVAAGPDAHAERLVAS